MAPLAAAATRATHDEPKPATAASVADSVRSSADGVYTLAQATRGRDVFAIACQSCHTPTQHSGPPFRQKWFGRTLADLYDYVRTEMPQTDPGTMSDEEYILLVAYTLRINGMPPGPDALAPDPAALRRIRLDSVATAPSHHGSRR